MSTPMLGILILAVAILSVTAQHGGSKCHGTTCASGPAGQHCTPKYERANKCCPVWYCRDRYGRETTYYGMSSSHGGSMIQSSSSTSGNWNDNSDSGNFLAGLENLFAGMFGR